MARIQSKYLLQQYVNLLIVSFYFIFYFRMGSRSRSSSSSSSRSRSRSKSRDRERKRRSRSTYSRSLSPGDCKRLHIGLFLIKQSYFDLTK